MAEWRIFASNILAIAIIGSLVVTSMVPPARAPFDNLVCIAVSSSTSCPASTASLTGFVGGQLTVAVNIQNAEALNGFDIITVTEPAVLQPVSNDLTGFLFEGEDNLVLANTVNAAAGTARVAVILIGAFTTPPTTGRLFKTTYNIIGPGSGVTIGFQQAIVTNPDAIVVSLRSATFSSLTDFSISTGSSSLTTRRGVTVSTTIALTSLGFTGTVALTATVSPVRKGGPTTALSPTSVALTPNGSGSSTLTITTSKSTSVRTYTITVTGTGGSLSHSIMISLTVTR